ncbi:MAG: addiction module protein [Planctomycetes bacterium]|nr:addiction module protein [Planctomycetota bacterium]
MTGAAEQLKPQLLQLPVSDRAELVEFLLHSLDEDTDADAEAAWDEELGRRLKDIESGSAVGIPADEVFAALRKKYS